MRRRPVVLVVAFALVVSGCGNAVLTSSAGGSGAPGVTSDSITVGSIANVTGILSSDFAPIVDGVKAYFDMVNAEGGVDGRKILLPGSNQKDDQGSSTTDLSVAQELVEQDHVFAVVGVGTPFFGGASFLAQKGVPTFGYQVSNDWSDGLSLFGAYGSYLAYDTNAMSDAYVASQLHATSVGVVAYGVPASAGACQAAVNALPRYGITVGFQDLAFGYGADPIPDVLQMKSDHVDFLLSCLDVTGNVAFAQAMAQYGLDVHQLWLNGYDRSTLQQYGSLLNGVTVGLQHVPFEAPTDYPGVYPGMQSYLQEMAKYEPSQEYDEVALEGWINASQFVTGLRSVGRDLTQKKLVATINSETAFTADGVQPPLNWTNSHNSAGSGPFCTAYVEAENGKWVPDFVKDDSVFNCFALGSDVPVTPAPGTPGS